MDWIIEFDIAAFIISATILVLFLKKKNYLSKSNKQYRYMMTLGISASVLDIVSAYAISYAKQIPLACNLLINMLFLLCMNLVAFVYYFYVVALIDELDKHKTRREIFMKILLVIDAALIASSPFTGWVFYFDSDYNYCSGPLKTVIYVIAMLVLVACLVQTVRNRKILSQTQKNCVYFYSISNLLAVVIQCIFPKLLITNFAIAIAFMIIYITLQRPEDRMDSLTQLENKFAFLEELNREVYYKDRFFILVVKLDNLDSINEMIGITQSNKVIRKFTNTLIDAVRKMPVYRIGGARFAYIGWSDKVIDRIMEYIEHNIEKGYELQDMVVQLKVKYCILWYPNHGKNAKELEDAIQYCVKSQKFKETKRVLYADADMLEEFKRKNAILGIIRKALDNRSFQVYYQPIYNWRTKIFDSAEALIRLQDAQFGFISPEEFIPMAEKNGLIVEIGDFVIEEVCRMLKEENPARYGVKYVHINLSGVQCMQKDLGQRIEKILRRYGISSDTVCFEITETAAIHSDSYMTEKIKSITDDGFRLALDDYGSGFATFGYLLKYPFHSVKFDKEMVWQAMSEKKAEIALNHLVRMMKELGLEIVAEGVETKDQAERLKQAGCDLFQGYYYAKPMPKEQYIAFLREKHT